LITSKIIAFAPFVYFVYAECKYYIIIIIIIIIIIVCVITFMQGIYNYIPETNHVSSVYSVAAALYLQFVLHVMLFRVLNMFCIFTLALTTVRV
jgi:ABC-type nitrate/sulfonate/bicarbonate transport system permease component